LITVEAQLTEPILASKLALGETASLIPILFVSKYRGGTIENETDTIGCS